MLMAPLSSLSTATAQSSPASGACAIARPFVPRLATLIPDSGRSSDSRDSPPRAGDPAPEEEKP